MAVESAPKVNAMKTVVDIVVAPKEAFESLRAVPTWGLALAIAIILGAVGTYLMTPAIAHATIAGWPAQVAANPRLAQMTPEQQQNALNLGVKMSSFGWIFVMIAVPIYCLIESLIMLVFDKLGRGEGSFGKYFAANCNIAVPVGIGTIVTAIITIVRGPDSFATAQSVQAAMPSLGTLIPVTGKLGAFLATVTPISLWATGLAIGALLIIGRVPKLQAWLGGIVLFLIPSLLAVAFAK